MDPTRPEDDETDPSVSRSGRFSAAELYAVLEVRCWAPWLRFSASALAGYQHVFPRGQLVLEHADRPVAMLTTTRIDWMPGRPCPRWQDVAALELAPNGVSDDGAAVMLLSISVAPEWQGRALSTVLIQTALTRAQELGTSHVVSDFRPSDYGRWRAETGHTALATYLADVRDDGLPRDRWLRTVRRAGFEFIDTHDPAMEIVVSLADLEQLREQHHPERWRQLSGTDERWDCDECGIWSVDRATGTATYAEPNVFGVKSVAPA